MKFETLITGLLGLIIGIFLGRIQEIIRRLENDRNRQEKAGKA